MLTLHDARSLLQTALSSPRADFRPGQWQAIDHVVNRHGKVLCIQRTGWGKSMVYFIAASALRTQGYGVTLIVSPLLALMRNQIEAAARLRLRAEKIDSTNPEHWPAIRQRLLDDQADLLLVSPERLANDEFVRDTLLPIAGRIGLLVVDEAHCISDWGHDFRPDYRRIGQILARLPDNIAVLATTATANRRVQHDVAAQLGRDVQVQRGPLMRDSLALQVMRVPDPAERLAWLAERLPQLPGSGIVYALTQRDTERVAGWLQQHGIDARAYHAALDQNARIALETALLDNALKCLVATTALGMGYDKPDLGFVIHYQMPGSVIGYYQQVGRAGRAIERAYGVLMSGTEDADINEYFRDHAFPPQAQVGRILSALEAADDGLGVRDIECAINLRQSRINAMLKLLAVEPESPVLHLNGRWYRTPHPYALDRARIEHLTRQREEEWAEMQHYVSGDLCCMQFLALALDDDTAEPCGRCSVCLGRPLLPTGSTPATLIEARRFLHHSELPLALNRQWDRSGLPATLARYGWKGTNIPKELRGQTGRILARWNEQVWGQQVASGKSAGSFDDTLVAASIELIRERWPEAAADVRWVTCIPSLRHPRLVPDFAQRVAAGLGLPFRAALIKQRETEAQKTMENRFHQCHNLDDAFRVEPATLADGAVLLIDDVYDSGWTLTLASALLREAGVSAVFPFALATTATR